MSLRKIAALLAALGLIVGAIGSGVGAQFFDSVTANEHISVGTFECKIVSPSDGIIAGDGKSVTYTAPTIMSSAPGTAPFSFTVENTGSITDVLTVSVSAVSAPFSIIGAPFAPVTLTYPGTHTYNTGIAWSELSNANLGTSGTVTWTVNCGENLPAVIFDNTAAELPGNLPSYGPEAYAYNEWGPGGTFAGTARNLATATVTLSSWACQSGAWYSNDCLTTPGATFSVPIRFNVYNVGLGNTVGSLIATKLQTFNIAYRPSADATNCTGGNAGKWYDSGSATCFNGRAQNITFNFAGEALPNTAIFGITFDTRDFGYSPSGVTGPTDSLNIATYPGTGILTAPSVGTLLPDGQSTYLSTGPAGGPSGAFAGPVTQMPTGPSDNFVGYMPAVQITATN